MRRADTINLSTIDPVSIELPATGERTLRDTIAPGLALRLRSSGSRTWVVFGRDAGRTTRHTLGDLSAIPLAAARRLATADTPSPASTTSAPLHGPDARIGDVLPIFLAAGSGTRWKRSTVACMEAASANHILPTLGRRRVRDLTREEVARWHLDVTARSTAARIALSTLSGLMLYAEDHGLRPVGTNPCRGLRKKERGHRGQLLPAASIKRLWAALDRLQQQMPDACDAVRLLLLTGARRSEILGLEWDRIVGPRAVLEDSKTGPRTIWLNAAARTILHARKAVASTPFVFPMATLDRPMTTIDRQWTAIRSEAKLEGIRLHDLRHHFASVAVANGIDLRVVAQLLGHHELDSTLGYAHLAMGALVKSASRVSGYIDQSLRGGGGAIRPARQSSKRAAHPARATPSTEACRG